MHHCIVIDDESLARERISSFVEEQENWQVDGQSGEFKEAERTGIYFDAKTDIRLLEVI